MSYEKYIQRTELRNLVYDRAYCRYPTLYLNDNQTHLDKGYRHILFDSKPVQSAELNEMQSIMHYNTKILAQSLFADDGALASDPNLTLTYYDDTGKTVEAANASYYKVAITNECTIYYDGSFFKIPAKQYNEVFKVKETGAIDLYNDELGVLITEKIVDYNDDSTLYDPKAVSDLGVIVEEGARRFKITMEWFLASDLRNKVTNGEFKEEVLENYYIIYLLKGGVNRTTSSYDPNLKNVTNIVARYDFNAHGNYVIEGLITSHLKEAVIDGVTYSQYLISNGQANVKGYNFKFPTANLVEFKNVSTDNDYLYEATDIRIDDFKYNETKEYSVGFYHGFHKITKLTGQKKYGPITITRGNDNLKPTNDNIVLIADGNVDKENESFYIESLKVVGAGGTQYTYGVDYKVSDDLSSIEWITKNTPAWGSSYQLEYIYNFTYSSDSPNVLYQLGDAVEITSDRTKVKIKAGLFDESTKTVEIGFIYSPSRYEVIALKYAQINNRLTTGEFVRIVGKPSLTNPRLPQVDETNYLVLAYVKNQYGKAPLVKVDYYRAFRMSDILEIYNRLDTIEYNIAKNTLYEKASMDVKQVEYRDLFIDTFRNNSKRDSLLENRFNHLI